jgi:hypothetical protein
MRGAWLAIALACSPIFARPATAVAATLHEFPHPVVAVQFHPRGDRRFQVSDLTKALVLGVSAAELDLRWRDADSSVVCAHDRRDVKAAPTLADALGVLLGLQGEGITVQHDGLQFFLVLDLKEERPAFHRALVRALADRAAHWASSGSPTPHPRGITVVISGFRAVLERSIPRAALDTLCIVEGRDYGARIQVQEGPSRSQWLTVDDPIDRWRIRDLHEGRDPRARGRFNVRVVGAGSHLARDAAAGADAVNADLEEIPAATRAVRALAGAERRP